MAKAFRTDIVTGKKKFVEEIQQFKNGPKPERVPCPSDSCPCSYEMFGYQASNRQANITTLQERILREHPDHTSEILSVNQFRRPKVGSR